MYTFQNYQILKPSGIPCLTRYDRYLLTTRDCSIQDQTTNMKTFNLLCVIMGIILLIAMILKIGMDPLRQNLMLLGWGIIPIIFLEGLAYIFHTLAWRRCLSEPYRSMPFLRLYWIMMAGFSINYITPTAGLGGEVTKSSLLSLNHRSSGAVTGVIIDKLSFAASQLVSVVFGSLLLLFNANIPKGVWCFLLIGSTVLGMAMITFFIIQRHGKLGAIIRWFATKRIGGQILKKAADSINRIDTGLKLFYKERPLDLPFSILWHIAGFSCGILQCWCFLSIVSNNSSLVVATSIWLLSTWLELMAFAIPTNVGVIEATQLFVFKALNFGAALGLTYGITLRIDQLLWSLFGLIIYAIFTITSDQPNKKTVQN